MLADLACHSAKQHTFDKRDISKAQHAGQEAGLGAGQNLLQANARHQPHLLPLPPKL